MPKGTLEKGSRWAALTVTEVKPKRTGETLWDANGDEFYEEKPWVEFQCDCGKSLGMWVHEWPGKRAMRDCGCKRASIRILTTRISFTTPFPVYEHICQLADKEFKGNFSAAATHIMKRGLENNAKTK